MFKSKKSFLGQRVMRHLLILSLFVAISLFAALFVFLQKDPPEGYEFLFFLPFSFALVSLLFNKLYRYIPDNLAISLMIFLFFCRMVLSPCALCLGNYTATINLDVKYNLFHAICTSWLMKEVGNLFIFPQNTRCIFEDKC